MAIDFASFLSFFLFSVFIQLSPVDSFLEAGTILRFTHNEYTTTIEGQSSGKDECVLVLKGYTNGQALGSTMVRGAKSKDGVWQFHSYKDDSLPDWITMKVVVNNSPATLKQLRSLYFMPWSTDDTLRYIGPVSELTKSGPRTLRFSEGMVALIVTYDGPTLSSLEMILKDPDAPANNFIIRSVP